MAALIHSGVRLSLSDSAFHGAYMGMDTSHVGAILANRKDWPKRSAALKAATRLIETWNQALSGDVYVLVVETYDKDKNPVDLDTLGGVYGYNNALAELAAHDPH